MATTSESTFEPNETLYVNLSGATNAATISDNQGIGTIINDDPDPNNPPVANNDSKTVNQWADSNFYVLANDSDADGDTLTITSLSGNPSFIQIAGDGKSLTYVASTVGTYTMTYTVSDGKGGTDTAQATLVVNSSGGGFPF